MHLNPADFDSQSMVLNDLRRGGVIELSDTVHIGQDPKIAITNPPTVRVEQVFRVDSDTIDTVRITS